MATLHIWYTKKKKKKKKKKRMKIRMRDIYVEVSIVAKCSEINRTSECFYCPEEEKNIE